jgi:MYXO-CTERM domain-containing protein
VVYVFVQSGTTWTQQAELTASDNAIAGGFPASVSLSGDTALVGAYAHQVGANMDQGAAYVFVRSGTTWTQQAEFTASDGAEADDFGYSVSVSGGTALVGAQQHQVGANAVQGAAYVFVAGGASGSANGTPCTANAQCASAICGAAGTGNCCAAACSTSDPACGATACASGTGACVFPTSSTTCGVDSCTGSTLTTHGCDGSGTCAANAGTPCPDNLDCNAAGTACLTVPDAGGAGGAGGAGSTGAGNPSTHGGCGCRLAGEPTPREGSPLAVLAAMAMIVGLRRRLRGSEVGGLAR